MNTVEGGREDPFADKLVEPCSTEADHSGHFSDRDNCLGHDRDAHCTGIFQELDDQLIHKRVSYFQHLSCHDFAINQAPSPRDLDRCSRPFPESCRLPESSFTINPARIKNGSISRCPFPDACRRPPARTR